MQFPPHLQGELVGWIRGDAGPTVNCMLGHRKAESDWLVEFAVMEGQL